MQQKAASKYRRGPLGAEHLVTAYQVHSPHVVVADQAWTRENAPRADAVVTRTRSLAVGITTADCGSVPPTSAGRARWPGSWRRRSPPWKSSVPLAPGSTRRSGP